MGEVWTELQIDVAAELAEILAAELAGVTGGVELRDADTIIRAEPGHTTVVVQCAAGDVDDVLAIVDDVCGRAGHAPAVRRREADEDEWRDVWKQYFRATRV